MTPPSRYCACCTEARVERPGLCDDCASHPALVAAFAEGEARRVANAEAGR